MEDPQVSEDYRAQEDANQLRILSFCYYIFAGLSALGAVTMVVLYPKVAHFFQDESVWMFRGFYRLMVVYSFAVAIGHFLCGLWLHGRKNRVFCILVAAFTCLSFPLGTALGVFTLIVLARPSVQAVFEGRGPVVS